MLRPHLCGVDAELGWTVAANSFPTQHKSAYAEDKQFLQGGHRCSTSCSGNSPPSSTTRPRRTLLSASDSWSIALSEGTPGATSSGWRRRCSSLLTSSILTEDFEQVRRIWRRRLIVSSDFVPAFASIVRPGAIESSL